MCSFRVAQPTSSQHQKKGRSRVLSDSLKPHLQPCLCLSPGHPSSPGLESKGRACRLSVYGETRHCWTLSSGCSFRSHVLLCFLCLYLSKSPPCVSQSDKISAAQFQQQQLSFAHHLSKASAVGSRQRLLLSGWRSSLGELPAAMCSAGITLKQQSWNGPSVKANS